MATHAVFFAAEITCCSEAIVFWLIKPYFKSFNSGFSIFEIPIAVAALL